MPDAVRYTNRRSIRNRTNRRSGTSNSLAEMCIRDRSCAIRDAIKVGGSQLTFIPEGDWYRLIVHSKLPSAERFERWVFDEVLPTIRKHGAYLTKEKLWEVATSPEAVSYTHLDVYKRQR